MTRINVVDEGADKTGTDPIDPILDKYNKPNTEFYFPPGRYRLDTFATDNPNIQFTGDNATLVPTYTTSMRNWMEIHGDGWTFDGFEIDFRDCPYPPRFHIQASGWQFSNIAVRGYCGTNGEDGQAKDMNIHGVTFIRCYETTEDGTSVFKNVYLRDGSGPPGARTNRRGFLIEGETMRGTIVFNGVWMEQWGENTIYANNHPGQLEIRNSFFRNTNVGVRVGGRTTIEDSTFVRNYDVALQRQGWSGGSNMRGIRIEADDPPAYPGELLIKDCDFKFYSPSDWEDAAEDSAWASRPPITWKAPCEIVRIEDCRIQYVGYHGSPIDKNDSLGSEGTRNQKNLIIRNAEIDHTGWKDYAAVNIDKEPETIEEISGTANSKGGLVSGTSVDTQMVEGTPKQASETPKMANPPKIGEAPGERNTDEHLLVIDSTNTGRVEYELEVSGTLRQVAEYGASVDKEDKLEGNRVDGWANNYLDAYRFDGEIREFTVDGDPKILFAEAGTVKAKEITVEELLDWKPASTWIKPENAKLLIFDGRDTDGSAKYRVEISGDIAPAPEYGSYNRSDSIDGRVITGRVVDYVDAYWYNGEIEELDVDGNCQLKHAPPSGKPVETTVADLTATASDVSDEEASAFTKALIAFLKRYFG